MAMRQAFGRAAVHARVAPAAPAARMALPSSFVATRHQSTARPHPRDRALNLINMAPGENLLQKTSFVTAFAGLAAYAISKEIYIIEAETLEGLCMIGAFTVWYSAVKDTARDFFNDQKERIRTILTQARADHKAVVQERIDHVNQLGDVVETTKSLYEMSREIAKMEAEAYQLKQTVAITNEARNLLDGWVRYEASVREKQQKNAVQAVIDKVLAQIEDEEVQRQIMAQALRDIEKASKA
ncbi:hypothetical protein DFJ74DRAFT_62839 [Hyaloraphidium curvatum]|nr:hypothetical protein DFJ74DRAFT_62839 [Hyaloraphidium curvatum]